MEKKIRVAVIFGGKSGEHEVSLSSAASVIKAMDRSKYEVFPMAITREGEWKIGEESLPMLAGNLEQTQLQELQSQLPAIQLASGGKRLPSLRPEEIDVVFPVLHGTYGEDGTIQGMLEMANLPYVGAGVLASAVGMDKVMSKKIFAQAGLPQGRFLYFLRSKLSSQMEQIVEQVEAEFGYPCFIKPANLGSSVGISKATDRESLIKGLELAAKYDRKVIVEEFIPAREIEVAVLGNDDPIASVPGEIISCNDFYDYKAKYVEGKSIMQIPADLPEETAEKIREMAIRAYQAIDCSGLARVDFFLRKDTGEILINEVNTLPGFTPYSMYPKMWEYSGISYPELIDRLIQLAIERYEEKQKSVTTVELE